MQADSWEAPAYGGKGEKGTSGSLVERRGGVQLLEVSQEGEKG